MNLKYAIFKKLFLIGIPIIIISIMMIFSKPTLSDDTLLAATEKVGTKERYEIEIAYIDSGFTPQEQFLIEEAMLRWQNATKNRVVFYTKYRKGYYFDYKIPHANTIVSSIQIKPIYSNEPLIGLVDEVIGGTTVGFYDEMNLAEEEMITLFVVRDRIDSEDEFEATMMHELGHSLSLSHTGNKNATMYFSVRNISCISQNDTDQFCLIHNCDSEDMNPCATSLLDGPTCHEKIDLTALLK